MAVSWGLAHRDISEVKAIGVDEVLWHRGHKYLTVVYEISAGCKRLLWVGKDRKESTIDAFFDSFGDHAKNLEFVCSDMWKPYLKVIAPACIVGHSRSRSVSYHVYAEQGHRQGAC